MRAPWIPATLVSLGLSACPRPPPPTPDASLDAPRDSRPDARVCDMIGDCECFSNYDCPITHACVSQDPSGSMVSCVEGPRGMGVPGTPCTGEADCTSALCVDDSTGGMRCSDICSSASTCPEELPRCVSLGGHGICARQP
jgi:hypothetical protein